MKSEKLPEIAVHHCCYNAALAAATVQFSNAATMLLTPLLQCSSRYCYNPSSRRCYNEVLTAATYSSRHCYIAVLAAATMQLSPLLQCSSR